MSSSPPREPLSALIRQDTKVVGAICLPEEDVQEFIDQFNNCYGPMRMCIERPKFGPKAPAVLIPVGANFRKPLRAPIASVRHTFEIRTQPEA
ncbi:hypothetical protein [Aureliella helgolandensis]|uniref:Uncharacterized protein n=1 Tax=Aureliella helgolandensis TaxID=2527968 RepID=A0A518GC96_9BACT|nr:hypothetical protein [Aureliella helgolandensis]QDV26222.1 hypothetical protein Q31a_45940 [Aureliella helgolandensis]